MVITLIDFAVESIPNTPIPADAVPEPSTSVLALTFAGVAFTSRQWKTRRSRS